MALSSTSKATKVSARSSRQVSNLLLRPARIVAIRSSLASKLCSLPESAYFKTVRTEPLNQQEQVQDVLSALDSQQSAPWWQKFAQASMRVIAVIGVAFTLVMSGAERAMAAQSGGRVGGSSGFRSSSAVAARSTSSRASTAARSTRSHTTVHHTTVISTGPSWGFGWGMPMFSPFGWGAPMVYTSRFSATTALFTILLMTILAFVAIKAMRSRGGDSRSHVDEVIYEEEEEYEMSPPVTVGKLQVCLLGVARGLKAQLDALGASANTSTPEGLHLVLQETVLALLRNPQYCVYGSSSSSTLEDADRAERAFGSMTFEERAKVKTETLVNSSGMAVRTAQVSDSKEASEYMVVTLMVAAEGTWSLLPVRTAADLKNALTTLGGITPSDVMAVEVSWTPQADNDSLTQAEVMMSYPNLVPL